MYFIALISAIGSVQRMIYAKGLIKEAEKKGTLLPYIKKNKERWFSKFSFDFNIFFNVLIYGFSKFI